MAEIVILTTAALTLASVAGAVGVRLYQLSSEMISAPWDMDKLQEEMEILSHVFRESIQTIDLSSEVSEPVLRSLALCNRRRDDLEVVVSRTLKDVRHGGKMSFRPRLIWVSSAVQRRRAYNSFRDALLLLRDLVSDLRIQQQFINIGTTMATIMDDDLQWSDLSETHDRQQVDDFLGAHVNSRGAAPRTKERSQIMRQLIENDWISNVWVMVDVGKSEPARELPDTQSDFNFVSYYFLMNAGVDLANIDPVTSGNEIQGIVQGVTFKPSHQIVLSWVREKARRMHKSTFFIVGHPDDQRGIENDVPDYDIIVSKAETANYFRGERSTLIAASRKKTDAELKAAQDARAKKEKEEAEKERKKALRIIEEAKVRQAVRSNTK